MNTSPHPLSLLASPKLQQSMGQGGGGGLGKEVRFGGGPFPNIHEEEREGGGNIERSHLFDCNRSRGPFLPSFSFFGPRMQSGRKKRRLSFPLSWSTYSPPLPACALFVVGPPPFPPPPPITQTGAPAPASTFEGGARGHGPINCLTLVHYSREEEPIAPSPFVFVGGKGFWRGGGIG